MTIRCTAILRSRPGPRRSKACPTRSGACWLSMTTRRCASVATGVAAAVAHMPAFAVVDLRLADGSGLEVVKELRKARPGARVVMLTGYGNIATAVAAVKAGAIDYLPKPADADAVERALL